MISLLLFALAQPASADRFILEDDVVLCCTDPLPTLPVPAVPIRAVAPPRPPLPPGLLDPLGALTQAQQRLVDWEALRADPPTDPKALLARLEALGATTDLKLYRRAARRGWSATLEAYLDDEVEAQQARLQAAEQDYLAALRQPVDGAEADVWRLLTLSEVQPALRTEIAHILRIEYPDGPYLERTRYLSGATDPEQIADLEALLAQAPDSEFAPSARLHLARAALLRADPAAAARHASAADGPLAALLYAQALLGLEDAEDALQAVLALPEPEAEQTTARVVVEASWVREQAAMALIEQHGLDRPGILSPVVDDLVEHGRLEEAAVVLERLLWEVTLPGLPERHLQLASLYSQLGEVERVAAARLEIIERYHADSEWAHHHRSQPEALEAGLDIWKAVMRSAAMEWHQRAQLSGEAEDYQEAARLYQELGVSLSEDRWLLVDALVGAGQDAGARALLEELAEAGEGYSTAARYRLVLLYRPAAEVADVDNVQETVALPSGASRDVLVLSADAAALVETVDALAEGGPPLADDVSGYAEAVEEDLPSLLLLSAEVLSQHGHLDAARARYHRIIERYTDQEEAGSAALQILQSHLLEEDLVSLVEEGEHLGAMMLPDSATIWEMVEHATFLRAQQLAEPETPEAWRASAEAFLAFVERYPDQEHASLALYNAGVQLERAGDPDRAQDIFERFITMYPDDELAPPLMFRTAAHYASLLELERGIDWYERLIRYTGADYPDTPAAYYNAGMLRAVLGDHRGAAEVWERYARVFPDLPDAEAVMFAAGAQWLNVSDAEAQRFFQRYLQRHRFNNPGHAVEAHYHLCQLRADRCAELLAAYERHEDSIGPRVRHLVAMVAFAGLDPAADLVELDRAGREMMARYPDAELAHAVLYTLGTARMRAGDPGGEAVLQQALSFAAQSGQWSPWLDQVEAALGTAQPPLQTLPLFASSALGEVAAWEAARERLRNDRSDTGAEASLAALYLSQGEPERAAWMVLLGQQRTASAIDDPLLGALLGEARRMSGDHGSAHAALQRVPSTPETRLVQGHLRLDAHDWDGALEALQGLSGAPAILARGIALHRLGRTAEAERAYREAAQADTGAAAPHHNLAVLYAQLGRDAEAEAARAEADSRN